MIGYDLIYQKIQSNAYMHIQAPFYRGVTESIAYQGVNPEQIDKQLGGRAHETMTIPVGGIVKLL